MKTAWLRSLMNRYGALGVLLVGAYLLIHSLWQGKRAALACAVSLALLGLGLAAQRTNTVTAHHGERDAMPGPGRSMDAHGMAVKQSYYSITDLGTLGGKSSIAFALNDNGQVVGG